MAFQFNWAPLQIQQINPNNNEITDEQFARLGSGLSKYYDKRRKNELEDERRAYDKRLWDEQLKAYDRQTEEYNRKVKREDEAKRAAEIYSKQIQNQLNSKQDIMAEIQRLELENQQLQSQLIGG